MSKDAINPDHYKWLPNGIEAIDICENLGYNLGNVVKYILRAGRKDPSKLLEDLKKAQWYLNREIEKHDFVENRIAFMDIKLDGKPKEKILYSGDRGEIIDCNGVLYAKMPSGKVRDEDEKESIAELFIEAYGCRYNDLIGYFENPVSPDDGKDVKLFRVWITKELEKKIWG